MNTIKFRDMDLQEDIQRAIEQLGFESPTEIQAAAIPLVKSGRDVIGQAQTGTGKTFSFAIPIIEKIDPSNPNVQALVLCPTRELSLQVYAEFIKLVKYSRQVRVVTIYGGQSIERQISNLRAKPQIIIGTPGRIIDHMNRKTLNFENLGIMVLDEADEMLKMGFQEDLEYILATTPSSRQTVLFSATIPPFVKQVAKKYQRNPEHIKIEAKTLTVDRIKQYIYEVPKDAKPDVLVRILDFHNFQSSIIFCNTKKEVDDLVLWLQKNQYSVDGLHGDLKQMMRDRVMASFRSKNISILVATDVAARGIDVNDVEAIFNYDIPQEDEIYVHRIGRTGRAGKSGVSITFATNRQRTKIRMIEQFTKSEMEKKEIPSIEDIKKNRLKGVYNDIVQMIESKQAYQHTHLINKLMADGFDGVDIINALLEMAVKEEIRDYNEIVIEAPRRSSRESSDYGRDRGSRSNYDRGSDRAPREKSYGRSKKYIYASIDVGRQAGVRPPMLLDFFSKQADVLKENVGDIVINPKNTNFEITEGAFKRLMKLQGKELLGKRVKVDKIDSLK